MKVLIRMLASILPGVVVGLGVIGYLERESIQEEWSSIFGHHDSEDVHHAEVETEEIPVALVIKDEPEEKKPLPVSELKSRIFQDDVDDNSSKDESENIESPEVRTEPISASVEQPVTQVMEQTDEAPVLDEVLGLEKKEPAISLPGMMDDLPITAEQVIAMRKPIQKLAEQFDPLAQESVAQDPYSIAAEKQRSDIWHVDSLEEESELQWLWNRGRQAFWEGDYELAVESYRSLLEEEPMNPDGWGELGNIYYAKKDWTRAVRAFGRAAVALVQSDRADEAEKILTIIRGIDPALADQLSANFAQQMLKKQ